MRRFLSLALLCSCAATGGDEPFDEQTQTAIVEGSPEAIGVLAVANELAQTALDDDVGLDARAAKNIATRRNGADKQLGTGDDNPYDTIAELDAVAYVGKAAFDKLLAYALANGFVPQPMLGDWELENPSPDETLRMATFALSATDVWNVGANGFAEHFDGTRWTTIPTGVTETLTDVWGAAANDVWVTGAGGTLLRWNGTAFVKQVTNQTRTYLAVHGASANDVWIVGASDGVSYTGRVMHWNGSALTARTVQYCGNSLYSVFVKAPNDVWIGGDQKTVCHWNGTAWSDRRMTNPYYDTVTSIYAGPSTTLALYDGSVYRYTASTNAWTHVYRLPDVEGFVVPHAYEMRGRSDSDVYISGSHGMLAHYNGSTWSTTRLAGDADYAAITLAGSSEAWAVGRSARARLRNGTWSEEYEVVTRQWLRDAAASSPTNVWALGSLGDILRRGPAGWQRVASPFSLDNDHTYAVLPLADDDVWFGGAENGGHWNGTAISIVPELRDVSAMWAASKADIWAVGEYGGIKHYDGTSWTQVIATNYEWSKNLYAIAGTSASDVWAVGHGRVLHYDGTAWTTVDAGVGSSESVSTVVAIAPDDVWIAGESQLLRHFDGTSWTAITATAETRPWIKSARASGPDDVWFVLNDKELLHWNGTSLQREAMPGISMFVLAGGEQWALGQTGTIRHR